MSTPNIFQASAKITMRIGAASGIAWHTEALTKDLLGKRMTS